MPVPSLALRPETPEDADAIERLHACAFGPGRFARTAYRLREGAAPLAALCFTARLPASGDALVGSVRMGPVEAEGGGFLALGPLAVAPDHAGRGIGGALMHRTLGAARAQGHGLVVLVGDATYYDRFGFRPVPTGHLTLPGPVDPARLLWLELVGGAGAQVRGCVRGRPFAQAPAPIAERARGRASARAARA